MALLFITDPASTLSRIAPVLFNRLAVYLGMFLTGDKLVWDAVG